MILFEILLLVTAVSIDAFTAGFAYGVSKVRVPWQSVLILAGVSSLTLCAALLLGNTAGSWIPEKMTDEVSFLILFGLGIWKLADQPGYREGQKADRNQDKILSPTEALALSAALSLDSVAAGLGAGVMEIHIRETLAASFAVGALAVWSGCLAGRILSEKIHTNLCWVSGILLLYLAFLKLAG
ncbi:MAG: manganese efflux pump [Candidatus Limivivens sp.]|nr:manganese efflux pump [Candidatus Limivivens sp.]